MIFSATPSDPLYDLVIYGGTSAGISAGIHARREGRSVIVLEPTEHIGGLTTGGLGQTDIGNKHIVGGISREFYQHIRDYYRDPANWKWQQPEAYKDNGQTRTHPDEDAKWTFEPSAAQKVIRDMIAAAELGIHTGQQLRRNGGGVIKEGEVIREIVVEDGTHYRGRVFIDATYEGDLLAEAGVGFRVGREDNEEFGETLNGAQPGHWNLTLRGLHQVSPAEFVNMISPRDPLFQQGLVAMNSHSHQLKPGLDPYRIPGSPGSGLLPGIDPEPMGRSGAGDHRVQAFNLRLTLTDHPDNRIPIEKPDNYAPLHYELLLRHLTAHRPDEWPQVFINSPMPNCKTDTNNGGGFSTNLIGENWQWPEASYTEREAYTQRLRNYILGFLWTLQYHRSIREDFRQWIGEWGLPKDEFTENGYVSPQVYVREGRRMIGELIITQHHCERLTIEKDIIGMAAYGMDSHHVRRTVTAEGHVRNEGNVQGHITEPYDISYRAITPKRDQADNLLVPVALSSTHIAFGSIRMEPVFMILGQSAAISAGIALDLNLAVQDVPYPLLRTKLMQAGQVLEESNDVPTNTSSLHSSVSKRFLEE